MAMHAVEPLRWERWISGILPVGIDPSDMLIADVGCDSGRRVAALLPHGVRTAGRGEAVAADHRLAADAGMEGWLAILQEVRLLLLVGLAPDDLGLAAEASEALGVEHLVALVPTEDVREASDRLADEVTAIDWRVLPLGDGLGADRPVSPSRPPTTEAMATGEAVAFYNGACPICSAEIDHYKRVVARRGGAIAFHDVHADRSALSRFGIDGEAAKRRMYAVDEAGRLHGGIDAFAVIWERLPGYGWAARLIRSPRLRGPAAWLYDRVLAPGLYRFGKWDGRLRPSRRSRIWTL